MTEEHSIIVALCRCALFNATDATRHQIERLSECYASEGNHEMTSRLTKMLNISDDDSDEQDNFKIVKS